MPLIRRLRDSNEQPSPVVYEPCFTNNDWKAPKELVAIQAGMWLLV